MENNIPIREDKLNKKIEIVLLDPNKLKLLTGWEQKFLRDLNHTYEISGSFSAKQKNICIPILKKYKFY